MTGAGRAKLSEKAPRRLRLREERSAQHLSAEDVGVGHLDTFHLPGYAVGPSYSSDEQ